jgi:hypothetical protein
VLLYCADRLNPDQSYPLHLRRLLTSLGIKLRKEVSESGRVSGLTRRTSALGYEVVLMRSTARPRPLTSRERFTIAHELGHILLDVRLHWQPRSKDEYRLREEWCNRFAARLLVPAKLFPSRSINDPADALELAVTLSGNCRVSLQMAARRVAEQNRGVVFFALVPTTDTVGKRGFLLRWSTEGFKDLGIRKGKRLASDAPWSALASHLESSRPGEGVKTEVAPWGSAAALRLTRAKTKQSLVSAVVSPAALSEPAV